MDKLKLGIGAGIAFVGIAVMGIGLYLLLRKPDIIEESGFVPAEFVSAISAPVLEDKLKKSEPQLVSQTTGGDVTVATQQQMTGGSTAIFADSMGRTVAW